MSGIRSFFVLTQLKLPNPIFLNNKLNKIVLFQFSFDFSQDVFQKHFFYSLILFYI